MVNSSIDTAAALKYFKSSDRTMYRMLNQSLSTKKPLQLPMAKQPSQYFASIVSSIIGQQISTKAASAVRQRVTVLLGSITPESVNKVDFEILKACGLSEQKTRYIKRNAEVWHEIPFGNFVHLPDEAVIVELTKLHGVGRWTAEMFMIFSLARPDVFSFGDLGLMQSLYQTYNYKPHFVRKIDTTVQNWSPHRTLASLALWHARDNGPELL